MEEVMNSDNLSYGGVVGPASVCIDIEECSMAITPVRQRERESYLSTWATMMTGGLG